MVLFVFLSGCGSQGKVAAVVNGQVITAKEIEARLERLNPATRQAIGNDRRRLLEEMIMETLLLQEARRRGLHQDAQVEQLLKEAHRQILIGRLVESVRQSKAVEVSDEQIAQFYQANKALFREPESFRASHILLNSEEDAKKALARLKGGESFAKLAEELSVDPTKTKGGDIGFFSKGQLIPEFEKACENLKPGETSGIVKSPLGYHIILLAERRGPRERSLDEVKDQIRRQLGAQGQQRQVEAFAQELRSKAQITIREPFASASPPQPSQTQTSQSSQASP